MAQGHRRRDRAATPRGTGQRLHVARIGQIRAIELRGDVVQDRLERVLFERAQRDFAREAGAPSMRTQGVVKPTLGASGDGLLGDAGPGLEGELDDIRLPAMGNAMESIARPSFIEDRE